MARTLMMYLFVFVSALAALTVKDFAAIQEGVELIEVEGPAAGSSQRHPEVVSEELYKRQNAVVDIYNRYYFDNPEITGDMRLMLTIEADGKVSGCVPIENTTGSLELAREVAELILTWTLPSVPEAEYQSWVTVTVPYRFMPPRQPTVIELSPTTPGTGLSGAGDGD
ncbi:MAG TPA: AgmX/PglI C-terminal domain-containing protein [Candidatus Coatesbacteria bacterium]|nr:AgmX/PglI C-terminal domain-containing protein [Candidatus Coatesbacteria bacterium]